MLKRFFFFKNVLATLWDSYLFSSSSFLHLRISGKKKKENTQKYMNSLWQCQNGLLLLENVLISLWNSHLFVNTYLSGEGKMLKSRWSIIIPKGFVLASLWNRYLFVYFLKTFWLFCEILVNENVKSKRGHPMTDHS